MSGEKKAIRRPAPVRNFSFAETKRGPLRKDFRGRYAFLVFIGFLYPPLAWRVLLCGQRSSLDDFLSVVVVYAFFFSVTWDSPDPRQGPQSPFSGTEGFGVQKPQRAEDQKDSRFRARLKISSEKEIFERATHRGPFFVGKSRRRD